MDQATVGRASHKTLALHSSLPCSPGLHYESQYLAHLFDLYNMQQEWAPELDRTGVGRYSKIGGYIKHDTGQLGPALLTSKYVALKPLIAELCWFLRGDTNTQFLHDNGCKIWDEWADETGQLGLIYGYQWRQMLTFFEETDANSDQQWATQRVDQIRRMLQTAIDKPVDSGNIVSAWNVSDLPFMSLRPCHTMFQIRIQHDKLDLLMYQRSADWFLGVPFNAASYTILQSIFAHVLGLKPGVFHHYFGDTHLYANQRDATEQYIQRIANEGVYYGRPTLELDLPKLDRTVPLNFLMDITPDKVKVGNYEARPAIAAPVAV